MWRGETIPWWGSCVTQSACGGCGTDRVSTCGTLRVDLLELQQKDTQPFWDDMAEEAERIAEVEVPSKPGAYKWEEKTVVNAQADPREITARIDSSLGKAGRSALESQNQDQAAWLQLGLAYSM
mmetsp:Transcript_89561/g.231176  ORF Transcript_89561/g.231176 Transcript_89561/m.231176 type:complete len:124 (+) Transcript_89561:100-471(+)